MVPLFFIDMAKKYDLMGTHNPADPLASANNNGDGNFSVLNDLDSFLGTILFGNEDASSSIVGELTGYNSQQREFAQQEYLIDKANEYNNPVKQMERLKAAGINPNLAAQGVSGNGSPSASPSSVSSSGANGAGALQAASGLVGAVGQNRLAGAQANEIDTLLEDKQQKLQSEVVSNLEAAGASHWNAVSIATLLPGMDMNQKADFYNKVAQYDNLRQEYKNLEAEHDRILADIDVLRETKELVDYQGELAKEEARWKKAENDFWDAHHIMRGTNTLDGVYAQAVISGNKELLENAADAVYSYNFQDENAAAAASWNARPNTTAGIITDGVNKVVHSNLIPNLIGFGSDAVTGVKDFFNRLKGNPDAEDEFEEYYDRCKDNLYENYKDARSEYKKYRRSGNSQYVATLKNKMDRAKEDYDNFTKEKFYESIQRAEERTTVVK